jgi:hypothetical protein
LPLIEKKPIKTTTYKTISRLLIAKEPALDGIESHRALKN